MALLGDARIWPVLILTVFFCGCLGAEYGWPPQKEFSFSVEGENLAGLPQLKQQFAGFRFHGEMRVQTHSPRVLLIKILNMNYTKIHEDIPRGWWNGPKSSMQNKTKTLPITTSTIVVKLTKAMSPEVVLQSGLDDWQVNFIKGLVGNLLTYVSETTLTGSNPNMQNDKSLVNDVYSVMEDSVVGRCEVLYEVSQLPRQFAQMRTNTRLCEKRPLWEVTRTRNYSNCQVLNEDHARAPIRHCVPGGNSCGNFWTRSSLTQMIGCGEKNAFMLLSSVSVSVVNAELHLQNNSRAVVNSNLNITLISAVSLQRKFNAPQNKQAIKTLLYTYSAVAKGSGSCQKTNENSEEDSTSTNESRSGEQDEYEQRHPKNANKNKKSHDVDVETRESHGKPNNRNSESREKRSLGEKYRKRQHKGSDEHRNVNNENGNSYSSSNRNNKNRHSADEYPSESNDNDNDYSSDNNGHSRNHRKNKNSPSPRKNRNNGSWQASSDELTDQPSEELKLEDEWKISGKEQKTVPPHQPFNMFSLSHRTSGDMSCLNPKLRQLVADITSDLQDTNILPEKNTMDKLSLAVDICRNMHLDQIHAISEEVFEVRSSSANIMKNNERKVFRDVVTMCGTHPALQLIKGWVDRRQVDAEEAAEMIASFPTHVFSPSNYLVLDFFEMVQQISRGDNKQLTITSVLALSNLVRAACGSQPTRQHQFSSIVTPVCERKTAAQVTEWLVSQMSSQPNLARVYVEALGNVGSKDILKKLKNIAVTHKYSSYLQTSAVLAMRYQALRGEAEMTPLLLSLFHNYSLPVSTRIAAVALLTYADPGLAVWQRLAISTYYDPSSAVSQFVASSLHTMANSKDTVFKHMTKSAYLVQPLARPAKVNSRKPYNLVSTQGSSDLQKLILEQTNWMRFYDYTNLYYRHSSRDSDFPRNNIEASFTAANPDELWSALKELYGATSTNNGRSNRSPSRGIERTLSNIRDSLDLHSHSMPEFQADLHLRLNNMMERMILINKDDIKNMVKDTRKLVSEFRGKSLNYQKADMNCFHISTTTEMGFPVEFSVRTPWIINSKADLNVTKEGLQAQAYLTYAHQLLSSVSVMSGWDNVAHSAGAYATNFMQFPPLRVKINLDNMTDSGSSPTESIKLATTYIDQHRLLYFAMQPFTSQRKLKIHQPSMLSPDTMKVKIGEPVQMPFSWLGRHLNTVYTSEEKENFKPMEFIRKARMVMGFPMMMPNMEARSVETIMNPIHPIVMNLSMSSATKSMGMLEVDPPKYTVMGKLFKMFKKNKITEQSAGNSAESSDGPVDWKNMTSSEDENSNKDVNSRRNQGASVETNQDKNPKVNETSTESTESSAETVQTIDTNSRFRKGSNSRNKNEKSSSEEIDKMGPSLPSDGIKVFSTTYQSVAGNFNATEIDPFQNLVNGSSHYYLIEQILEKIISGRAVVLGFNMWSDHPDQKSNISAYAAVAMSHSKRAHRVGLFLKKDESEMKMTVAHEHPVDIAVDLKRKVSEDLVHKVFVDYVQKTSGKNIQAFIRAKLGMNRGRQEQLSTSTQVEECSQLSPEFFDYAIEPRCQSLFTQAMEVGFGNITVNYNQDAKLIEQFAEKYMNAANIILPWTEEKSGEGSNTLDLSFDINDRTQAVNAFLKTPSKSIDIYRFPLSKIPMKTVVEWALQTYEEPSDYCGLSTQRMRTFDGVEFPYKIKDSNWYLVTRDCSDKYGFSVLARSVSNSSLEIEVNLDDLYVITVTDGPKVAVNNEPQPVDTAHALLRLTDNRGRLLAHIVYTPDNAIHLQLPNHHLDILYSQSSLIIRGEQSLEGRLCGLCGSYTSSGVEQMRTSHGSTANSLQEFLSSYMLKGSGSGTKSDRRSNGN